MLSHMVPTLCKGFYFRFLNWVRWGWRFFSSLNENRCFGHRLMDEISCLSIYLIHLYGWGGGILDENRSLILGID